MMGMTTSFTQLCQKKNIFQFNLGYSFKIWFRPIYKENYQKF